MCESEFLSIAEDTCTHFACSQDLYSQAFPKDRPTLKAMVYGVYLLEMTQTGLLTGTAWNLLVKGFGRVEALNEVGTIWLSVCFIGGASM